MLKGILIDPATRAIESREWDITTREELACVLGCDRMASIPIGFNVEGRCDVLHIAESTTTTEATRWWRIGSCPEPLAGQAVILGGFMTGPLCSTSLTPVDIRAHVDWLPESMRYLRHRPEVVVQDLVEGLAIGTLESVPVFTGVLSEEVFGLNIAVE
jgi:hypothetical protein